MSALLPTLEGTAASYRRLEQTHSHTHAHPSRWHRAFFAVKATAGLPILNQTRKYRLIQHISVLGYKGCYDAQLIVSLSLQLFQYSFNFLKFQVFKTNGSSLVMSCFVPFKCLVAMWRREEERRGAEMSRQPLVTRAAVAMEISSAMLNQLCQGKHLPDNIYLMIFHSR